MNELSGAANVKPSHIQNDQAALRNLCGMLNDPRVTGAQVPADEKKEIEKILSSSPGPVASPSTASSASGATTPTPSETQASASPLRVRAQLTRVFLTGRAGSPNEVAPQTGAFVIDMKALVDGQMKTSFGVTPTPAIAAEFYAWSSGVVSAQYPMTLTRVLLESLIRKSLPTFGQPDYWIQWVLSQAVTAEEAKKRVIVIGVESVANFKALQKAGFIHYHVMLSNLTAQNKAMTPNPLSDALDNDVIKKISFQKEGARLHTVWHDNQPCPSGRFYSLPEFLTEFQGAVISPDEVTVE